MEAGGKECGSIIESSVRRRVGRIAVAELDVFPEEVNEDGVGDVVVIYHDAFIDGDEQKGIARAECGLWFENTIVERVGGRGWGVGMPFLALRMDVLNGALQLIGFVELMMARVRSQGADAFNVVGSVFFKVQ